MDEEKLIGTMKTSLYLYARRRTMSRAEIVKTNDEIELTG